MASASSPPAIISVPRITTLLTALLVTLGSGTNYVYSAYAPQLGSRLHITHTQLNIIAAAGIAGVYTTSPFWGKIVDARGPRILLASAFFLLLGGYSGFRHIYDVGVPDAEDTTVALSTFSFCLLVLYGYMTGAGSSGGMAGSVNTTAKTFPDKARATTTGLVSSGFGLSALVFSAVAHTAFPGDPSSLLLVLSLGTSLPMILGFFFVRPIPLLPSESEHKVAEEGYHRPPRIGGGRSTVFEHSNESETDLLAHDGNANNAVDDVPQVRNAVHLGATGSRTSFGSAARMLTNMPNIYGKQLLVSQDFWILFTVMALLNGTGLMWINNVGSISQALLAKVNPSYDDATSARWQATQVSTVSFLNFTGRIFIGLLSDYAKNRLHVPRSYCVCLVAFLFVLSQVIAASVDDVHDLWKASAVLGLAYGGMHGLTPTVSIEWFGLVHFSETWGYLSISSLIGGNLFSIAFGRNLDAHASPEPISTPAELLARSISSGLNSGSASMVRRADPASAHRCLDGRACYTASLTMTIVACLVALGLSLWAAWRDRQKQKLALKECVVEEVVWEDETEE